MNRLNRGLTLWQAVAINMIDMVGIGPFVTIPLIIGAMHGPICIMAWVLGAVLAFVDGSVWAELGAKWPEAGGSYVFLQKLYGKQKWGRLFSFLYIWQTTIQAPLVIASGAIGFSIYLKYLLPNVTALQQKAVSGGLVILVTALLYRKITSIGKISLVLGLIVCATLLWVIISGLLHFDASCAFDYGLKNVKFDSSFVFGWASASKSAIYCYLGYYNVCHLGGEIKNPQKNIPRSIFISITCIAVLYLLMQVCVSAIIPWQQAAESKFIISTYFEKLYGTVVAQFATVLILLIAISSLFAVMLGYSRVPYAAAIDGNFFPVFGKLHPTKQFPYVSLLVMGAIAFVFSLLLKMKEVIAAIIVMRILVQFIGQAIGLMLLHQKRNQNLPFKMWLYPLPPMLAIAIWAFVFCLSDWQYILGAIMVIGIGALLFLVIALKNNLWPFD